MEKNLVEKLKELLKTNSTTGFTYKKKNGEERHAYGTTNTDSIQVIDENALPSGVGTHKEGVVCYFDLDKNAWRSFREDSLIVIDANVD